MKRVKGFYNYSVDRQGRIYSHNRKRFMTTSQHELGYMQVWLSRDNKTIRKMVHRLFAEAYIPNPEQKPQINHINGDRSDNRLENLEWCTGSENVTHAYRTGLRSGLAFKPHQVVYARKMYDKGVKVSEITRRLNSKYTTVDDCVKRRTYKYIE